MVYVNEMSRRMSNIETKVKKAIGNYYDNLGGIRKSFSTFEYYQTELEASMLLPFFVPKKKYLNILDLGCGMGRMGFQLSEYGFHVIGIDISKRQIKNAISLRKKYKIECEFLVGDAEKLPFKKGSFDGVVSMGMLEYVDNPEMFFEEIKRVLVSDGLAVLTSSHRGFINRSLIRFLESVIRKGKKKDGWDIYSYTMEEISLKARSAGFRIAILPYFIFIPIFKYLFKALEDITFGHLDLENSALAKKLPSLELLISKSFLSKFLGLNLMVILYPKIDKVL